MKQKEYIYNLETTKIELYFEKTEYASLTEEEKKVLKSSYLWSKSVKAWVSRAKEPNLYNAKKVANKLGFTEERRKGERLTFAEQLEVNKNKAENRADKYEEYSNNAKKKGENLQKELNSYRGDNSFFTQPVIAGHKGSQKFANYRQTLFDRYNKGFDEYRKSKYFKEKATIIRDTTNVKLTDKGYLARQIKGCAKKIKQYETNIVNLTNSLYRLEQGETLKRRDGSIIEIEELEEKIYYNLELADVEQDKEGYYCNCIDELGGINFNRDNINVGYIIKISDSTIGTVVSTGALNIRILTEYNSVLTYSYAEILEVIEASEIAKETHPFVVGDKFNGRVWFKGEKPGLGKFAATIIEIIKTTNKSITMKITEIDGEVVELKPVVRIPKKHISNNQWVVRYDTHFGNIFYKKESTQ